MQTKKEAIEIVKAQIENAINCNKEYQVTVTHQDGKIIVDDKFGETTWTYETSKVFERAGTSTLEEIAASSYAIRNILDDIRLLIQAALSVDTK
jgi:hypothetical protein